MAQIDEEPGGQPGGPRGREGSGRWTKNGGRRMVKKTHQGSGSQREKGDTSVRFGVVMNEPEMRDGQRPVPRRRWKHGLWFTASLVVSLLPQIQVD